jgi:hypothetical protein
MMRNTIQPRDISKGGDIDGTPHITSQSERQAVHAVPLLERRQVELECELARQQPER